MGNSVFDIAVSALNAAQLGLSTTSNNIANASTPGYNRQQVSQSEALAEATGGGFVGNGVQVNTIQRVYSQFLTSQLQSATAQNGYLTDLQSHLSQMDNLLADPTAGFSPALQSFFTGVQTVSNNPTTAASRQSLLGLGQSMITNLQTLNSQLSSFAGDINTQVTSSVASINSITNQIASLNQQILTSTGAGGGNQPNALLDQRDQLVTQLNQYVKSTVVQQSDGSYNIFIGNGQNLVVGTTAFTLGAVQSPANPGEMDVAYQQYGSTSFIPSTLLTGGSLGSALQYRQQLDQTQATIGQVAMALAQSVNTQNKLGQDLNSQGGRNLFQFPVEQVDTQTNLGANAATLTATNTASQPFVSSDYNVTLDPTSGNYIITQLSDGQTASIPPATMTAPGGQTAFGINFQLSTNLAPGESFDVSFLPAASSVIPNTNNTGNGLVQASITNPNLLTNSSYSFQVGAGSPPSYTLTRLSDGRTWDISAQQWANPPVDQYFSDGMDGLRLSLTSGTLKTGDSYLIQPTQNFPANMSMAITDPSQIAAGYTVQTSSATAAINVNAVAGNTGTGTIANVTSVVDTNGGANAQKVNIVFNSPTTFNIQDAKTGNVLLSNQAYTAGNPITFNGWSVAISGAPATGDSFAVAPATNTGTATISAGAPSGSPLNVNLVNQQGVVTRSVQPVAIQFTSPTNYNLINPMQPPPGNVLVANQTFSSGTNITYEGWTAQVTGVPATGDTFMLIESNSGSVSDSRNILAMGQLQTANLVDRGSTNFQGAYSQMVSNVGVQSQQANSNQKAQAQLLQQAQTNLSNYSGVNLDEEASNLLIFQQAYQAASKTIQVAQTAFDTIMQINA